MMNRTLPDRTQFFISSFIIFVLLLLIYYPSFHYSFLRIDDFDLTVYNSDIKGLDFRRILSLFRTHYVTLYSPLTMLSYSIDYQIWNLIPFGFRFTNFLLHFCNSLMLLYFIFCITRNKIISFFIALIFAIHPLQIESVVWISERKNVLSSFFCFASFLTYWRAMRPACEGERREINYLIYAMLFYAMGILSKPSIVVLPFVFLAIDFFILGNQRTLFKRVWFYFLMLLLSAAIASLTIWGTASSVDEYAFHGGSYTSNISIMATVFWRYFYILIDPSRQNFFYSSPHFKSWLDLPVQESLIGILCLSILFLTLLRNKWKQECFWMLWFLIFFLPVSNLIAPFPSIMQDRYMYLPMIGFFAFIFTFINRLCREKLFSFKQREWRLASWGIVLLAVTHFGFISVNRIPDWRNSDSLYYASYRRSEKIDPRVLYHWGVYKIQQGNLELIPCPKSRCEIAYKLEKGKLLGKQENAFEVYGGKLGLVVDGSDN